MVSGDDAGDKTSLQALADHCVETGDLILFVRNSFGWEGLVECLNQFDGSWHRAAKVTFSELGVGMTDGQGESTVYRWSHFGISPTLV